MNEVFYLCDGEKPDCPKTHCYKTEEDGCRHTSDIKHAVNFKKGVKIYREIIRSEGNEADDTRAKE